MESGSARAAHAGARVGTAGLPGPGASGAAFSAGLGRGVSVGALSVLPHAWLTAPTSAVTGEPPNVGWTAAPSSGPAGVGPTGVPLMPDEQAADRQAPGSTYDLVHASAPPPTRFCAGRLGRSSMTSRGGPAWLTENLRVLSLVSLLQDAASELLYPLLPIYLTTVLGAPPSVVGAVEGAAEGAASFTKVASGPLGDRFARRPLIGTGYGMAALGKLIVAAAGAWPGVLVGRVVDRLGKGLRGAPRDALLVDGVKPAERGRVYGFHRMMDTFGAVIGPLLGLAGYELFHHQIRPVLYLAVIPAVLSVLLIARVRERPRETSHAARPSMLTGVRQLPRRYWGVVAFLVAFSVANFPDALLLLRLKEIGFSVVGVILAYVGYNAVYAVASFPAGMLADRFGRSVVYGVGLIFFAVGYLGLGITTNAATAWGLIVAYGLFTACYDGVGKAWISAIVGGEMQSSAQGVFQGLSGFAVLAAGLWAGFLWGVDGRLPLLISGMVGAMFALALLGGVASRRLRANPVDLNPARTSE